MGSDERIPAEEGDESGSKELESVERIRTQSAAVRDDLRELGRLTRELAGEKLADARRAAGDLYDKGRQRAGDLETDVAGYVREKPLKAVLIAAGVGAFIGMLLSRR